LLYVSNIAENSTVTGYSLNTGGALGTVPTSYVAEALAFSPDGSTVYAAEAGDYVGVINAATGTLSATIPVGYWPTSLAVSPNGSTVYVTNAQSNTISVISTDTDTVTSTIAAGASPQSVIISPDGSTLYVADDGDEANNETAAITEISTATGDVTGTITLGANVGAMALALSPDGTTLYTADGDSNAVSVISLKSDTVTARIPVGLFPDSLVVTPDGRSVYVADSSSGDVSVISTATDAVTASIPVAGPSQVANYPDGGSVFVTTDDGVSVIATQDNAVTGTVTSTPDAIALAISPNPAVTSVSPATGPAAGGNKVTVTGVGYNNVLAIDFGGAAATSYTVVNPTTIVATVPPGTPGSVYVFVTTYRGDSAADASSHYTYQGPPPVSGSPSPSPSPRGSGHSSPSPRPSGSGSSSPAGPTSGYGQS
jgi:YVTN family beta-propeller protein